MKLTLDKTTYSLWAKRLAAFLKNRPKGPFKHGHALEGIARMLGYPNHNTLVAELGADADPGPQAPVEDRLNHRMQQLGTALQEMAGGVQPKPVLKGPAIKAEAHSDDRTVEAAFDARPWFAQASEREILALHRSEWGGNYEADEVAEFCAEEPGNDDLKRLFDYLGFGPRMPSTRDPVGFECHIDEENAMAWLEDQRPQLAALIRRIDEGEADYPEDV